MPIKIAIFSPSSLTKSREAGFTLIEIILYLALLALFIGGSIIFAWDIIFSGEKSRVGQEVNQNARLAARRIVYEVRNASAVQYVNDDDICLASSEPSRNPTRIYLDNNSLKIAWGGGSANCTSMTNDERLTSNSLTVTDLNFSQNENDPILGSVHYSFTISHLGTRQEWQASESVSGSTELRSN